MIKRSRGVPLIVLHWKTDFLQLPPSLLSCHSSMRKTGETRYFPLLFFSFLFFTLVHNQEFVCQIARQKRKALERTGSYGLIVLYCISDNQPKNWSFQSPSFVTQDTPSQKVCSNVSAFAVLVVFNVYAFLVMWFCVYQLGNSTQIIAFVHDNNIRYWSILVSFLSNRNFIWKLTWVSSLIFCTNWNMCNSSEKGNLAMMFWW